MQAMGNRWKTLSDVGALALDSAGNLYMPLEVLGATTTSYFLLQFAAGANGIAVPAARVSSSAWNAAGGQTAAM